MPQSESKVEQQIQALIEQNQLGIALANINEYIVQSPETGAYYALRASVYNELRKNSNVLRVLKLPRESAEKAMLTDYKHAERLGFVLRSEHWADLGFMAYHSHVNWQDAFDYFTQAIEASVAAGEDPEPHLLTLRKEAKTKLIIQEEKPANALDHIRCLLKAEWSWTEIEKELSYRTDTPLFLAAVQSGSPQLLQFILEHKGETEAQVTDAEGNTALHIAMQHGHTLLIDFLRRYIDYNALNAENRSPVMLAAEHGHLSAVDQLLQGGAATEIGGHNVLKTAIAHHQIAVVELLVESKRNVIYEQLVKQCDGIAGIFVAVIQAKHPGLLTFMLNACPDAIDQRVAGLTLLQHVIRTQHLDLIEQFVAAGVTLPTRRQDQAALMQFTRDSASNVLPFVKNILAGATHRQAIIEKRQQTFIDDVIVALGDDAKQWSPFAKKRPEVINAFTKEVMTHLQRNVFKPLFMTESSDLRPLQTHFIAVLQVNRDSILWERRMRQTQLLPDALAQACEQAFAISWRQLVSPASSTAPAVESKASDVPHAPVEYKRANKKRTLFCNRFEQQFDEAYGYFSAVSRGDAVCAQDQKTAQLVRKVASAAPSSVSVASVSVPIGAAAVALTELGIYLRTAYKKHQADRMTRFFQAIYPHERVNFVHYMAGQLANKYYDQIGYLESSSQGLERFADCAAARVIEYIISADSHQIAKDRSMIKEVVRKVQSWWTKQEIPPEEPQRKTAYAVFIDGIIRVTSAFPKERDTLRTEGDTLEDHWTAKSLFENTGIITEDGIRYASTNVDLARYGYCRGTAEEADKRRLTTGPNQQQKWPKGRDWQQVSLAQSQTTLFAQTPARSGDASDNAQATASPAHCQR